MPEPMETVREAVSTVLKRRVVKPSEQRRSEILQAALKLFSSEGFGDTTMDQVAQDAGVAKGTIYLYFPSKEHLLLALKREFMKGLTDVVATIVAEGIEQLEAGREVDYRDIIDDILMAVVDYHSRRREEVEVVVRQSPSPDLVSETLELEREYLGLITTAFNTGASYGLVHTTDPEMVARLTTAAIRDNIAACLCYGEPEDLERLVEATKQFLYKALAPNIELPARRPRLVRNNPPGA